MTHEVLKLIGEDAARGLRERNQYEATEAKMQKGILSDIDTPPVARNLAKWQEDPALVQKLQKEFEGKPIRIAVFGIATAGGIVSIRDFAEKVAHAKQAEIFAIDINPEILEQIDALGISDVITLHEDARSLSLPSDSIDLVIRDHIGNCCPPEVDRAVNKEAVRVLRKNGISMTHITTSELLSLSENRNVIPFDELSERVDPGFMDRLRSDFFDLEDIERSTGSSPEMIRGQLLEIEPNGNFVIFGSGDSDLAEQVDLIGHGEWFRSFHDHVTTWVRDGFAIEDIRSRSGLDSHEPKLSCLRHIVLLRKI